MQQNIVMILALLVLIFLCTTLIGYYFQNRSLKKKIQILENDTMLFRNGKRVSLTYKLIAEKHGKYLANLSKKEDIVLFEEAVIPLLFEDIANVQNYRDLSRYMSFPLKIESPFLFSIHRNVMSCYKDRIEVWFREESLYVAAMNPGYQLAAVERFIKELQSPYLREYGFILEILTNMELLRTKLAASSPISPISHVSKIVNAVDFEEHIVYLKRQEKSKTDK